MYKLGHKMLKVKINLSIETTHSCSTKRINPLWSLGMYLNIRKYKTMLCKVYNITEKC